MKDLRPLNAKESKTTTKAKEVNTPFIPTESPIVAKVENNPQEQTLSLTEDEGNETETYAELAEASITRRSLLQLHLTRTNLSEQKKF